ncbi:MAG: hypothetical protein FJ126_11475 [Deltaproteobacteria bacterium]|nr:hypothetical protein [Deltaproteobacteria bacterium]
MDYNLYYKSQNKIYCLNPMTGAKIWDSGSVLAWTFGTPAVGGGRVFVNNNGTVVALNAATGAKLWESAYPERLGSSPTLSGNAVYVTAGKPYVPPGEFPPEDGYTRICSLNAATGALLWDTGPFTTDLSWATPAVAYGRVYATFPDGRLYAFDQATGAKVWDKEATGYGYTLAVANGRIFASGDKLYAFNAFTGFKSWDSGTSITENIVASPVVANNRVYVAASWPSAGRVYAFNASTGAKLWSSEAVMVASNSPLSLMVAGGVIYIGSGSKVFAFDTGGNLIWSGETGTTLPPYPMVANGKVYVSAGLKLYAFDLENSAYYASLRARQAAAARRPDMAALVPDPDLKLEE